LGQPWIFLEGFCEGLFRLLSELLSHESYTAVVKPDGIRIETRLCTCCHCRERAKGCQPASSL